MADNLNNTLQSFKFHRNFCREILGTKMQEQTKQLHDEFVVRPMKHLPSFCKFMHAFRKQISQESYAQLRQVYFFITALKLNQHSTLETVNADLVLHSKFGADTFMFIRWIFCIWRHSRFKIKIQRYTPES